MRRQKGKVIIKGEIRAWLREEEIVTIVTVICFDIGVVTRLTCDIDQIPQYKSDT